MVTAMRLKWDIKLTLVGGCASDALIAAPAHNSGHNARNRVKRCKSFVSQ